MNDRNDGYSNLLTRVGTTTDVTENTWFTADTMLSPALLDAVFEGDGVGRRIVEMPAEEMCRGWFDVVTDDGEGVLDYLEVLRMQQTFTEAVCWARLYGGSAVYFTLDDGLDADQPVDFKRIRSLVGATVFDRWRVTADTNFPALDPVKRMAGRTEFYNLSLLGGGTNGMHLRVHESRLTLIPGQRMSPVRRYTNGGWDASVLQGAYRSLQRHGSGMGYAANIIKDFIQAVLSVKSLTEMIAAGREEVVERRIRLLDMSRSILNTMVIDADGEEYSKTASSVAGLADLLDRFAEVLAATTGIPVAKLFGRSAAGLNATGEHDLHNYYDMLAAEQNRVLDPLAEETVRFVLNAKDGPTGGAEPAAWSVRWRPLQQPSDRERAELRKLVADADNIYLTQGVLSPDEVAQSRFGTGEWSAETTLADGTDRNTTASLEPQDAAALTAPPPAGTTPRQDAIDGPETLYVMRPVLNRAAFKAWATSLGYTLTNADDLHVTVLYSRAPVDWFAMGLDWNGTDGDKVTIDGGPRKIVQFGDHVVLRIACQTIQWRHESMIQRGASHAFGEYKPHITLKGIPVDAEPYTGPIVLGPEEFYPVKTEDS